MNADEAAPEDLLAHVRGHWEIARALATRRDLERRQITHANRKRSSDLVRPRQPRHHPIPHTRSNRLHRGDPPLRPGPPPRTPATGHYMPLTRLNNTQDFDESLVLIPKPGTAENRRRDHTQIARSHTTKLSSPARSTGSGPGRTASGNSILVARPSTASTAGSMHSARRGRSPAQALRPRDGIRCPPWPSRNLRYGRYCLLCPSGSCAAAAECAMIRSHT